MTVTMEAPRDERARRSTARRLAELAEVRWALAALLLFVLGAVAQLGGTPTALWWALYLLCYATGGWEQALSGLRALREGHLDVDLLMIVAAVAAAGIGQVLDGALLIVIFSTSGALESFVTRRTEDSVRGLLDLAPELACRVDDDGREEVVEASDLRVGDLIVARPGERIGADGEVVAGRSEVDQASITGEPLPVPRQEGDEVFAGSLNGTGALTVRVLRSASESVVARIVTLVRKASATKAGTQLFVEKVEQRYSIVVVTVTIALVAVPLAVGQAFERVLPRAMTFMIVASPCAVVLATMPPLLAAIANAGRHGVLIRSAVVAERLRSVDATAFDKTGTLTEGTPRVAGLDLVAGSSLPVERVIAWAAAAEQLSEHPVARAVVMAARERGLDIPRADQFSSAPGEGIRAIVDGRQVAVGSPALLDRGVPRDTHEDARRLVGAAQSVGHTAVVVVVDRAPVAVIALADRLRADAPATVSALAAATSRSPMLLTGDNLTAARHLAAQVGIEDVRAGLLPEQKLDAVRRLQRDGRTVLLVGDGVNDAPALAAADVGVAMGRNGSDLAVESADAVIVRDELATVPTLIDLTRRAHRVVQANLVLACLVIVGLVAWDMLGTLPLPLGVAGHEGSTVVVGLNGLRLLRRAAWKRASAPGRVP